MLKFALALCSVPLLAQTALDVHRKPPPLADVQRATAEANRILTQPAARTTPASKRARPTRIRVQLDPAAKAALEIANDHEQVSPEAGKNGSVVFPYGKGPVPLVCAPRQVCVVELQPGETVKGAPQLGDEANWDVHLLLVPNTQGPQTLVSVRTKAPGLTTDLLIPTDRRVYYLHCVSDESEYLPRIAFSYPNDLQDDWHEYQTKLASLALFHEPDLHPDESTLAVKLPPAPPPDPCAASGVTRGYRFRAKHWVDFAPTDACDDGVFTFINLPAIVAHMDAPSLMLRTGKKHLFGGTQLEAVNYDVRGTTWVVHRLFDEAELVEQDGNGKNKHAVDIISPRKRQ